MRTLWLVVASALLASLASAQVFDAVFDGDVAAMHLGQPVTGELLPGAALVGVLLPLRYLYFKRAESYFADVI